MSTPSQSHEILEQVYETAQRSLQEANTILNHWDILRSEAISFVATKGANTDVEGHHLYDSQLFSAIKDVVGGKSQDELIWLGPDSPTVDMLCESDEASNKLKHTVAKWTGALIFNEHIERSNQEINALLKGRCIRVTKKPDESGNTVWRSIMRSFDDDDDYMRLKDLDEVVADFDQADLSWGRISLKEPANAANVIYPHERDRLESTGLPIYISYKVTLFDKFRPTTRLTQLELVEK